MNNQTERKQKVAEIFAAVLEKEPDERRELIQAECGPDDALRVEIEGLLQAFEAADSNDFLNASALELEAEHLVNDAESDARTGQTLGHYKLIEQIGAGGMGAIYLAARSDDFEKRVAVKIIKRGMDTAMILRRFRTERQILANLEHPFIAHLIDGGTTEDGLPFFVMEYVEGVPVTEYCRAGRLTETERLELFRKICAAVQFAHQKLIIHRDLKPSNILVNEMGEPKLLDFGIAKLLNSTEPDETQTHARVLTPAYASPEQLRGEIVGTASDVYSLGLILSETLNSGQGSVVRRQWRDSGAVSGQEIRKREFKFQSPDIARTRHRPLSTDHRPPSKDLQNILAMALREDVTRRYGSVEAFSEDIRRYLEGLPVAARRDSVWYRASKFIKRNRVAVGISGLLMVSLIGGLAATLWQAREARAERARAERRFNDVRGLVNTFLSELNDEMSKVSGNTAARKLLVQRTLEYLDNASRDAGGDTDLKRELATAYIKIGDIQGNFYYQNFGDLSGALISYQKALDILEALVKTNPSDTDVKIQLAKGYESMGDVLWDKGDLAATRDNYRKALELVEAVAAANPEDKKTQLYLSQLYTSFGDLAYLVDAQSFREMPVAIEYLNKGLAIREQLFAAEPDDREINIYLNQSYQRLINISWVKSDFDAELDFLEKDKRVMEKLLATYPNESNRKRDTAICYVRFARYLIDAGDFKQAAEYTAKSMTLREEIYNADKTEVRARRDLAFGYYANGLLQEARGDVRDALANFQKQLKIYEDLAAIDASNKDRQQDLIDALIDVGNALAATGDDASALEKFQRALEISRTFPADDPQTEINQSNIYDGMGSIFLKKNEPEKAVENFKKSIALHEAEAEGDKLNAQSRAALAKIYAKMGDAAQKSAGTDSEKLKIVQSWYRRSLEVWNDLREKKALKPIDHKFYEETANSMAKYDKL